MFLPLILTVAALSSCEQSPAFVGAYRQASDAAEVPSIRRRAYQRAIAICRADVGLYRELDSFLLAEHQFDAALTWIGNGLAVSPGDPELHVQQATAFVAINKPREALAALGGVDTAEASFYRGMSFRLLQDHAKAHECFLKSWQAGFRNPYVLYSIIQEEYTLHDKQNGLAHFQALLTTYPDSAWVHLLLADAYFAKEQNVQAEAEYKKALAQKPDVLEANFRLGYLAFQAGDRDTAARYFRNEVALNPNYADARIFLAETLLQLDRKQEAIEQFRTALKMDERSALSYKRLSTLYVETNQLQLAKAELTKAAAIFPSDPAFPAQLAHVLALLNEPKEAQLAAERARRLTAEQHRTHEALLNQ